MITAEQERKCKLLCADVEKSGLTAEAKESLIEGLQSSKDACNGLSQEDKIQANAVNLFWTNSILARLYLRIFDEGKRAPSWKDVCIRCQWAIVVLGLGVFALLALRPELAGLVEALAGK